MRLIILLSTYNGAAYLSSLLDSLMAQTLPASVILVRDDGSTDATQQIVDQYKARYPVIQQVDSSENPHLGATGSFLRLLRIAYEKGADYVAFCDQDDVWLPDKLSRAISCLHLSQAADASCSTEGRLADINKIARLYCSRTRLVDQYLTRLKLSKPLAFAAGFTNAVVENVAIGCTTVLNKEAIALIVRDTPESGYADIVMHDHWCYLVVSALGNIVFDEAASAWVLYRQHADNAVGYQRLWTKYRAVLKRICENRAGHKRHPDKLAMLSLFQQQYGRQLSCSHRKQLTILLACQERKSDESGIRGVARRWRLIKTLRLYRQSWLETALLYSFLLLGFSL